MASISQVFKLTFFAITLASVSGYTHLSDPARKWPNGIVYYTLHSNLGGIIPDIKAAIAHIEEHTCLRYVERTDQPNFVHMRQVTDMGCTAQVGFQGNGQQEVTIFAEECGFYIYLVHQLIQQAGMHHEHQRSDRDEYITVNTNNVDPESVRYFAKLEPSTHTRSRVYDVDSIMHYGSLRFSNNGQPTMLFVNGSRIKELPDKTELSPLDIEGINTFYNCPDKSAAGHMTSIFYFVLLSGVFFMFRM